MPNPTKEIYIDLQDEDVDVWRPTPAERLPDGRYRVLPAPDYDPEDEHWQFPPGSIVECEMRKLSKGAHLVAVRGAPAVRRTA